MNVTEVIDLVGVVVEAKDENLEKKENMKKSKKRWRKGRKKTKKEAALLVPPV